MRLLPLRSHRKLVRPVIAAIAASLLTLGLKSAAYIVTGSVGLFSDAAESLVNLAASLTALASVYYAARPIDADHTFGHEKIVYFSGGLEGGLIALAGAGTAFYAISRMIAPAPPRQLELGIIIALAASLINLVVARWLLHVGRKHDSIILIADGQHLMTDVWTSVAVVVSVVFVQLTNITLIDPLCALVMAGLILWTGWRLMRQSFDGLMDRALSPAQLQAIRECIQSHLEAGAAFHALRTRQAGNRAFVDFHLLVPGRLTVREAHEHADRIAAAVAVIVPGAEVTIHTEPIEEPASWDDSELIAIERRQRPRAHDPRS